MTQALTDKTICVMLRGGYKIFLTKAQADALGQALVANKKFIKLDDMAFNADSILFIINAHEIEREEKEKRGEWKCGLGFWHTKNQECGHDLIKR